MRPEFDYTHNSREYHYHNVSQVNSLLRLSLRQYTVAVTIVRATIMQHHNIFTHSISFVSALWHNNKKEEKDDVPVQAKHRFHLMDCAL